MDWLLSVTAFQLPNAPLRRNPFFPWMHPTRYHLGWVHHWSEILAHRVTIIYTHFTVCLEISWRCAAPKPFRVSMVNGNPLCSQAHACMIHTDSADLPTFKRPPKERRTHPTSSQIHVSWSTANAWFACQTKFVDSKIHENSATEMPDFTKKPPRVCSSKQMPPGVGICEILGVTNGVTKGAHWGQGFGVSRQGQQGSPKLDDPKGCEGWSGEVGTVTASTAGKIFHPLKSNFVLNLFTIYNGTPTTMIRYPLFLDVWGCKALCRLMMYSIGSRLAFRQCLVLSKISWWRNPQSN